MQDIEKKKARNRAYRLAHPEIVHAWELKSRTKNRKKILKRHAKYREAHREELRAKHREYDKNHKEQKKAWWRKYKAANLEKILKKDRLYREKNREKIKIRNTVYWEKNAEWLRMKVRENHMKDPEKKRSHRAVRDALKHGEITKKDYCEVCYRTDRKLICHHPDYNDKTRIITLCQSCHLIIHSRQRFQEKRREQSAASAG